MSLLTEATGHLGSSTDDNGYRQIRQALQNTRVKITSFEPAECYSLASFAAIVPNLAIEGTSVALRSRRDWLRQREL